MLDRIKQDVVKIVLTVQVRSEQDVQAVEEAPAVSNVRYQHADYDTALAAPPDQPPIAAAAFHARRTEGRPQRSVSLRIGQEIQALPRRDLAAGPNAGHRRSDFVAARGRPVAARRERCGRIRPTLPLAHPCRSTTIRLRPSSCCRSPA